MTPSLMASNVVCHCRVESWAASSALRAQERADGGDQLQRLGDVGQVAVGAAVQAVHLVFDIDKSAGYVQYGNRRRRRVGLDPAADLEAAHVGQLDVKDHQVRQRGDQPEGLGSGCGLLELEARSLERLRDRVPLGLIVVDEQDSGLWLLGHYKTPPRT